MGFDDVANANNPNAVGRLPGGVVTPTTDDSPEGAQQQLQQARFSRQVFLTSFYNKIVTEEMKATTIGRSSKVLRYLKATNPETIINNLVIDPGIRSFLGLRSFELSNLAPLIRIYKVFVRSDGSSYEKEYPFNNHSEFSGPRGEETGAVSAGSMLKSLTWNGSDAGIKSVDWSMEGRGRNPFSANIVDFTLKLFFQDVKTLFAPIEANFSYSDIIRFPPGASGLVPTFRLRIVLGWSGDVKMREEPGFTHSFPKTSFLVDLYQHDMDFHENGNVVITAKLKGSAEGVLSDSKSDILAYADGLSDATHQRALEDKLKSLEEEGLAGYDMGQGGSTQTGQDVANAIKTSLEKYTTAIAAQEKVVLDAKAEFADKLTAAATGMSIDKEVLGQFADWALTSFDKLADGDFKGTGFQQLNEASALPAELRAQIEATAAGTDGADVFFAAFAAAMTSEKYGYQSIGYGVGGYGGQVNFQDISSVLLAGQGNIDIYKAFGLTGVVNPAGDDISEYTASTAFSESETTGGAQFQTGGNLAFVKFQEARLAGLKASLGVYQNKMNALQEQLVSERADIQQKIAAVKVFGGQQSIFQLFARFFEDGSVPIYGITLSGDVALAYQSLMMSHGLSQDGVGAARSKIESLLEGHGSEAHHHTADTGRLGAAETMANRLAASAAGHARLLGEYGYTPEDRARLSSASGFNAELFGNPDSVTPGVGEKIWYFLLGDLLHAILNNSPEGSQGSLESVLVGLLPGLKIILGPVAFKDPLNSPTAAAVMADIFSIPIDYEMFTQFIVNKIVGEKRKVYKFMAFVEDLIKFIMDTAFSDFNFSQQNTIKLDLVDVDLSTDFTDQPGMLLELKEGTTGTIPFNPNIGNTANCLLLYAQRINREAPPASLNGNQSTDEFKGLFHFTVGGPDRGVQKSIKFSEQKSELFAAALYRSSQSGGARSSVIQPAKYTVKIRMAGNPYFVIGQMIYVNTTLVDGGYFIKENLAFGGYYIIISVSSHIGADKYDTEIEAILNVPDRAVHSAEGVKEGIVTLYETLSEEDKLLLPQSVRDSISVQGGSLRQQNQRQQEALGQAWSLRENRRLAAEQAAKAVRLHGASVTEEQHDAHGGVAPSVTEEQFEASQQNNDNN